MLSRISKTVPLSRRYLCQSAKPASSSKPDSAEGALKVVNSLFLASVIGAAGFGAYLHFQPESDIAKKFYKTSFWYNINGIYNNVFDFSESMAIASQKNLLPAWESGGFYGQIPPGMPPRPVLVIDLERTIIGSVYDTNEGWKHAKRPGLDKFIKGLLQYYEIILISENDLGIVQPIYQAIDPDNYLHKFGFTACESRDQAHYKVLYNINRDPKTVIFLDDNPESVSLVKKNAIIISPYENVNNKHDKSLTNLLPFLQGLVHEGITDFPAVFERLGTHDAHELAIEYRMKLKQHKDREDAKKNKGLGSLIRGVSNVSTDEDDDLDATSILSVRDIVGGSFSTSLQDQALLPTTAQQAVFGSGSTRKSREKQEKVLNSSRKKGALISSLVEIENEKSEMNQKKKEKLNEIHQKKYLEKLAEEEKKKESEE